MMTDQQPTPPPLDLDAIEKRVLVYHDAPHEDDVALLVAEVRRLRDAWTLADADRYRAYRERDQARADLTITRDTLERIKAIAELQSSLVDARIYAMAGAALSRTRG